METTDQKTIVKRIAKSWIIAKGAEKVAKKMSDLRFYSNRMMAYSYALEHCGLNLEEIIALGDADNLDEAIGELFC